MLDHLKGSRTRRPVMGWSMSLLVHAIGIAWLWHASPPRPAHPDTRPARRMEVWLLPPASTVPLRATVPVVAIAPTRSVSKRAALAPGTARNTPVVAGPALTPATPAVLSSPDEAAPAPERTGPAFDLSAARASARAMVRDDRAGLGTLPLHQETLRATTSERMQERLERARRGDCLKGKESVNLLANVISLAKDVVANAVDDSGCKL
jgi:hypothetical protein